MFPFENRFFETNAVRLMDAGKTARDITVGTMAAASLIASCIFVAPKAKEFVSNITSVTGQHITAFHNKPHGWTP